MTMKITSKKDFHNNFTFDLLEEIAILKKVQRFTCDITLQETTRQSLSKITDSSRPASHKQFYKDISYALYLCNFMEKMELNLDNVYNYITSYNNPVIDEITLRELTTD